ncbi:Sirohydrochlorin cobaltochelatase [Planktothrix tepida]|uniref:Cobalamin (Vitamin B12) biosynthesis CbiX protein n=1 Tax=Planktothrix tepida PCC 9214 TaxID=671072 RepID=A0A1J1LU05_9CYAN|nr:Sirohydrochlorin cobaltochelatase [Planktothrix tepida]CUR36080.1 Cobalamin (Vitamin B12) biosynthesis CbiX protein [Planktothrix tepida PCC 9214]
MLVAHGSRDPRPQQALNLLAKRLGERSGFPIVGTATLELALLPLHQQIQEFAQLSQSWGYSQVQILPLFLSSGVHVNADLPAEIAIAHEQLGSEIQLNLLPYFGSKINRLAALIATKMAMVEIEHWILIAHGSRHPGGNQPIEQLATQIKAIPAYWSVSLHFETQIKALILSGVHRIGIISYFMFSGGITDAIAQSLQQFYQEYPTVEFYLISPLEIDDNLLDLIEDLLK